MYHNISQSEFNFFLVYTQPNTQSNKKGTKCLSQSFSWMNPTVWKNQPRLPRRTNDARKPFHVYNGELTWALYEKYYYYEIMKRSRNLLPLSLSIHTSPFFSQAFHVSWKYFGQNLLINQQNMKRESSNIPRVYKLLGMASCFLYTSFSQIKSCAVMCHVCWVIYHPSILERQRLS